MQNPRTNTLRANETYNKTVGQSVVNRVVETIIRYSMFVQGQRVGVAVSGGADSVCLLHVLKEISSRWALKLCVLHLDHQLRGKESRADAEFVRKMAVEMGLEAHIREVDVKRVQAESQDNLEQTARQVRRQFFLELIDTGMIDRVALGHTRSDQAETVLFRLLRGSGTTGLAGILPVTPEGFVRPLLNVDRPEVQQFLTERGIPWHEDSTNRDLSFARNRIRNQLLPSLSRTWNPGLVETLSRMATLAQEEEDYWRREIGRLSEIHLIRKRRAILVRTDVLTEMPRSVARRLIRKAVEIVKGDLRKIDFNHVEEILCLAGMRHGDGRIQIPDIDVFRSFEWLRLSPQGDLAEQKRSYRVPLSIPGTFPIPGTDKSLSLDVFENRRRIPDSGYNEYEGYLDWNRISGPLELRNWRPGDEYCPIGHTRSERIKLLFQRKRVPLWDRRTWPIVTAGHTILWARCFGPADEFAARPDTHIILRVGEIG